MADCTATPLVSAARCLAQGMSERQLLAAILCQLATANGMTCDAATLTDNSRCLWSAMNERQLLAALLNVLCSGGGGAGSLFGGITEAAGPPPVDGSITTLMYRDSVTGFKYINLATVAAPDWDSI